MNLPKFLAANLSILLFFNLINGGLIPEDPINLEYPDELCHFFSRFKNLDLGFQNRLLLFGDKGVGKSKFVKNFALWTNSKLIVINCPSLESPYSGQAVRELEARFKEAREFQEAGENVIVFFEEVDSIASKITSSTHETNHQRICILKSLWLYLDEYKDYIDSNDDVNFSSIAFIFATNCPNDLDPVFESRIDYSIEYPEHSEENIKKFILYLVLKSSVANLFDKDIIDKFSKDSVGFNFRDLEAVFRMVVDKIKDNEGKLEYSFINDSIKSRKEKNKICANTKSSNSGNGNSVINRAVSQAVMTSVDVVLRIAIKALVKIAAGSMNKDKNNA